MNWLVDAQLPARLARLLGERREDAIHTLDLPDGNRSTDATILAFSARDDRIIVTKDADFVTSFRLQGRPRRLLLIAPTPPWRPSSWQPCRTSSWHSPSATTSSCTPPAMPRPRSWLSIPDVQAIARQRDQRLDCCRVALLPQRTKQLARPRRRHS